MSEQTVNETSIEIHGQHLQVRLNGRSLFNLHRPLDDRYQLTLEQDSGQYTIWMRQSCNGFARLFTTDDPELANNIMNTTADALQRMAMNETRVKPLYKRGGHWLIPGVMFLFLVGVWASLLINAPHPTQPPVPVPAFQSPVKTTESAANTLLPPLVVMPAPTESVSTSSAAAVNTPAQRVSLSTEEAAEARHMLATRLKNGAAKQEFTIQLSSGHPRTLYIFSDPECPNCRIFEPTVQALSAQYNVEVFPVTLIGKARTAEQVVPLLCAPADKRADMWRSIFDIGTGMLNPTAKSEPQPASCEAGQSALARNDMAFELYHLPGTPTVISDDGRMIPLQAMTSDAALQAFLNSAQ